MTNFDFLKNDPQFASFSDVAISAETLLHIDIDSCVINCRRAMEFAVKWMYSVDAELSMPYQDSLASLMNTDDFRNIVGTDIWQRMDLIRKVGNNAAHEGRKTTEDQAKLCLENLFVFLDFVAYCYGKSYKEGSFDNSLLALTPEEALSFVPDSNIDLTKLIAENTAMKEELTARRAEQQQTYVPKPLDLSEFKTRKIYIDTMLSDAGWTAGKNCLSDVKLTDASGKTDLEPADYVLYGDDGRILAIIDAKRTCADIAEGRRHAGFFADMIEKKQGLRPVVFLTNGFDTFIADSRYPERKIAAIYSKCDLERLFSLKNVLSSEQNISVDKKIAGRYYQEAAIKAVCSAFLQEKRRKALLVMAAGSGKTRTVIALCKIMLDLGFVKNILFLADRNSLVTQAKRTFSGFLPGLGVTNLCDSKANYSAQCVFSTYQAITNCIDSARGDDGRIFTCGHFDLVICDEAHRSLYNRYKDIFTYFDASLIGLTATPKEEIDKTTYEVFDLENGVPTYDYALDQAVKDGYLVDYLSVDTPLKFVPPDITYDDLSDDDKRSYEDTFDNINGELNENIASAALSEWIFSENNIREALRILMDSGLKITNGGKLGKTIIFAKNHSHAEKILKIFSKEYPKLKGFAKVIDSSTEHLQSAIDKFSSPSKLPQIAISVDILDTGIDVPEVLNLVFFNRVMSKSKFWQMIGRGARPCRGLIGGKDKQKFYIFDFCGNFEFFRLSRGKPEPASNSLTGTVFSLKAQIAFRLQEAGCKTAALSALRKSLVDDTVRKVRELNRDNFAVRQHLKYVEMYSDPDNYKALTYDDTVLICRELAPLVVPENDPNALRFDVNIYSIELACLEGREFSRDLSNLRRTVSGMASASNIKKSPAQSELINKILISSFPEKADILEFERIRKNLRNLAK